MKRSFSNKFQSRRYVTCVFHFSHFFLIQHLLPKKHAIGFKPELKIAQSCKKKFKDQNENFLKNIISIHVEL
jgi:hypothetical protein